MKSRIILISFSIFILFSNCIKAITLENGSWYSTLIREDGIQIPFNFLVQFNENTNLQEVILLNGEEKIEINEIHLIQDSIFMVLPYFNTELRAAISHDGKELSGKWIDPQRTNYSIMWTAKAGKEKRFNIYSKTSTIISSKWDAYFPEDDGSITPTILLLDVNNEKIQATFQTETGDYRFLEGVLSGDSLLLSVFDGSMPIYFAPN